MHTKKEEKYFVGLCETYYERILKYIYYSVGNIEDARDLTQEVFEFIYNRIQEAINHENIGAFIYQAAKYRVLNFKRKQQTKEKHEEHIVEERETGESLSAYEEMAHEKDIHIDETYYREDILSTITDEQKTLYTYRYIEKKSYKEIANLLETDEVTLRMRCLRLRNQLKKKVKEVGVQYFE